MTNCASEHECNDVNLAGARTARQGLKFRQHLRPMTSHHGTSGHDELGDVRRDELLHCPAAWGPVVVRTSEHDCHCINMKADARTVRQGPTAIRDDHAQWPHNMDPCGNNEVGGV